MNLVIVESPTKAKTITKFLGKDYKIESSFGHIRDLPKSEMGIAIDNNFEPKYIIPTKNKKNLNILKKLAEKADKIILATDEDREGEAIAWHLVEAMNLDNKKIGRIVFHEITKTAILDSLKKQREINMELVNAQQARRILDRLVGYELSPFLWKKVARGLSAGRVQSVAVRLIVEREKEIKSFNPQEYWTIEANLHKIKSSSSSESQLQEIIKARLNKVEGKTIDRMEIENKASVDKITKDLAGAKYVVSNVEKKQTKKSPPKPFTTSTLQQTANRWLGFSAKQTMVIAQQLYEGLDLGGESGGLITYMRTDSLNMSDKFLHDAKNYLENELGKEYALSKPRKFKTKSKGAQEAHEAIRPTEASVTPKSLKDKLNNNQYKLYNLIWQRAVASQMPEAVFNATTVDIEAENTIYEFRSNGQTMKFEGYLKIYPEKSKELILPTLEEKENLNLLKIEKEQHFTKPPARYSDAGLVKELEKFGIGRPSTYAPTIATIEARNYVNRDDNKKLAPTDIAFVVTDLLVDHFPRIVDFQFTAQMENNLDEIAEGQKMWQPIIEDFYRPFHENLENKYNEIKKEDIMPEEKSNEVCDKCGSPMIIKTGRYGKFYACSSFPECKNIKSMPSDDGSDGKKSEETKDLEARFKDEKCDKCGEPMAIKHGRFGPFLACTGYPKCKNIKSVSGDDKTGVKCPKCEKGEIVKKRSKRGIFYACDQYPDCKNAYFSKPTGEKCPECSELLVEGKEGSIVCSAKGCGYKK